MAGLTQEVLDIKDKIGQAPNVNYTDMFIIDQKLQQHYNEDRDSFMMRMISNVNHKLVQSFEDLNQKTDDKHEIMTQMLTIMEEGFDETAGNENEK